MCSRLAPICLALAVLVGPTLPTFADESACAGWSLPVPLKGFLVEGVFPGPPEFASLAEGDAAYTAQFLYLSQPICVVADPVMGTPALTDVDMVQLACADTPLVPGQEVSVTGTLFAPHSGYHRAQVLLACE